jgi:hypothetical protein
MNKYWVPACKFIRPVRAILEAIFYGCVDLVCAILVIFTAAYGCIHCYEIFSYGVYYLQFAMMLSYDDMIFSHLFLKDLYLQKIVH